MKIINTSEREVVGIKNIVEGLRLVVNREPGTILSINTQFPSNARLEIDAEEWHLILDAALRGNAGN